MSHHYTKPVEQIYIINGRTDVCLHVCQLVREVLMEIHTPASILIKFCTHPLVQELKTAKGGTHPVGMSVSVSP